MNNPPKSILKTRKSPAKGQAHFDEGNLFATNAANANHEFDYIKVFISF